MALVFYFRQINILKQKMLARIKKEIFKEAEKKK